MDSKDKFLKGPRKIKSPVAEIEIEDDEAASGHQKDGELGCLEKKGRKRRFIRNYETDEVKRKIREVIEEELIKDESSVHYGDEPVTRDKEDVEEKTVGSHGEICSDDKEPRESLLIEEMTVSNNTQGFKRRRRESKYKSPLNDDFVYEWKKHRMTRNRKKQEEVEHTNEGGRGSLVKVKNERKGKLAVKAQVTKKVKSETTSENKNGRNSRADVSRTRKLVRKDDCDQSQPNSSKVTPKRGSNRKQNKVEVILKCEDNELQVNTGIEGKLNIQDPSHPEPVAEARTLKCEDFKDIETEESMEEGIISYVIVPNATQRGKMRLVSSDGFTYNVKYSYMNRRSWICSHRPKFGKACGVVVRQSIDQDFFVRRGVHYHPPDSTALASSYIVSEIKKVPQDFLQGDIVFKNDRTLIFSTKKQLQLLSRTDRWYIDITQKFASFPFTHLMSISSYVRVQDSDDVVLEPLVFFIMSSISRINLRKAITRLLKHLKKPLCVRSFVLDFYPDLWSTIRSLFFNCKLYGCAWKFGQIVWAKVQDYGNQEDILELNDHIHKLLKLPFLPTREIRLAFQLLKEDFTRYPSFRLLIEYIEVSWLNNSVWRIANWSVFGNPFRTKSDVVSWHYSIPLTRNYISINDLVYELYKISCSLSSVQRPVHQGSVKQYYKGNVKTVQGKMFLLWEEESVMSHLEFLAKCCQSTEPSLEVMFRRWNENKNR
ncbi:uncharacterized protein [Macrobrachium rosenbergii]|uniref:uncharacterized protein isoform X2 n=1 Tax=Macrobrachium rosenbergii TaxID=79674 RepID=UPI0034D4253C